MDGYLNHTFAWTFHNYDTSLICDLHQSHYASGSAESDAKRANATGNSKTKQPFT